VLAIARVGRLKHSSTLTTLTTYVKASPETGRDRAITANAASDPANDSAFFARLVVDETAAPRYPVFFSRCKRTAAPQN
jgi:hypothetical protein